LILSFACQFLFSLSSSAANFTQNFNYTSAKQEIITYTTFAK